MMTHTDWLRQNHSEPIAASLAPRLIALTSNAMGAGKSTVAAYLVEYHGYELVKFAGPLKDMTRSFLRSAGYDEMAVQRMVEGDLKETALPKFADATPRKIMQTLGTEWGRDCIMPTLWVSMTRASVQNALSRGVPVVIDDLRYLNELLMVEELKGTVLRVERPGTTDSTGHSSEGALDGIPFEVLRNNGSRYQLRRAVDVIVSRA